MCRLVLFTAVVAAVAVVACAKSETKLTDSSGMAMSMAPRSVSVADFAGEWDVKAMPETGDSVLTTYVLTATADTTPWTIKFANGTTVPSRIMSVAGDSVVLDAGPYPSVLRKGVQVTTHSAVHLMDGKLMGTFVAHYANAGADSVLRGRVEGTKKP